MSVVGHYGQGGLLDRLVTALRDAGLPTSNLHADDLVPLDHFHSGGRAATAALADLAQPRPREAVLDVGAGLGGPARFLAAHHGCHVTCLDLTPEFCDAARLLTTMTGLDALVDARQGDALAMPFDDATFDVVWMQNASMNIADKRRLYGEVHRVLRPGGRFALQEVVRGDGGPIHLPVPWATRAEHSHLASRDELRAQVVDAGFSVRLLEDATPWLTALPAAPPVGAQPLGLHVVLPDMAERVRNSRRNTEEDRTRLMWALLVRP